MLLGCGNEPDCVPCEPAAEGTALSSFQASLLDPLTESVRAGVQPWRGAGIGVCQGARTCEADLGSSPGALPAGEYLIRADLTVPPVGGPQTWTVVFEVTCTAEGAEPETYRRTYTLTSPGLDRPYRLPVLRRMTSPNPGGPESCTYRLSAPYPEREPAILVEGAWSTL